MRAFDSPGYSHHAACTHSNHLGPASLLPCSLQRSSHRTCHSLHLSRSRLMRGCDEDVILPRRCDVCVPATMLATHIMQLALTASILELYACDHAPSKVTPSHLPLSALVKVQVDAWGW